MQMPLAQLVSIVIAGSNLLRQIKGMMVLELKYLRNEKCYINKNEMVTLSNVQKVKEAGSRQVLWS